MPCVELSPWFEPVVFVALGFIATTQTCTMFLIVWLYRQHMLTSFRLEDTE